jgi:integrase
VQRDASGAPYPHTRPVVPWNKGHFVGPKPPLKPKQVWAIRLYLQREQRVRDLAMFDLAIDSKLRGCDLVRLKIGQLVVNGTHSLRRTKIALIYKRTGNLRAVQILLGHTKLESTVRYLGVDTEDALILSESTEI